MILSFTIYFFPKFSKKHQKKKARHKSSSETEEESGLYMYMYCNKLSFTNKLKLIKHQVCLLNLCLVLSFQQF